jgi:hypothetical protein
MLVVVSDGFVRSAECDFRLKFAHSLNPGIVSFGHCKFLFCVCFLAKVLRQDVCVDISFSYCLR